MEIVLVTGAASGIGRETALAFAREGSTLLICDIDPMGLAETEAAVRMLGRDVLARKVDVSRQDEVQAFADEVHRAYPAVDVLINNAGVVLAGGFLDTTHADWSWILGVNLWGVIHGCQAFVPNMVARGKGGHVVNMSSDAGYLASEYAGAYATTKFAIFGLSEALRDELRRHRIGVSTICPGVVDTSIVRNARNRGNAAAPGVPEQIAAFYKKRGCSPAKVAAQIVDAVRRQRDVVPVTPEAWARYILKRISPSATAALNRFAIQQAHRRMVARAVSR